ncbi:ATP-grasp fold amidoligase family protein [Raoultella sp. WB_B2P2-3]|uniref:ATP-grasp fold amidoligase family protein n=1 Tax=Raoultella scottii TaxID=3040937 RepID=A0ABU8Z461_9ENTR
MNRLNYFLRYSEYLVKILRTHLLNDKEFHTRRLQKISGRKPDLVHPVTLSEKICHRMIYDHNPFYTLLADKLAVREYIYNKTDKLKLAALVGVYSDIQNIDLNSLPDRFVLKCNHDSGSSVICTDKQKFNTARALSSLSLALKKNMYYSTREWQYKNIPPVILCEEYIDLFTGRDKNTTSEMLRIHCFHGIAGVIEADFTDERGNDYINVYDRAWRLQPFLMEYPNTPARIPPPDLLHQAITAAQELSRDLDYCRVDLMLQRDDIYFSEITLSPRRGKLQIYPAEWDIKLGQMW